MASLLLVPQTGQGAGAASATGQLLQTDSWVPGTKGRCLAEEGLSTPVHILGPLSVRWPQRRPSRRWSQNGTCMAMATGRERNVPGRGGAGGEARGSAILHSHLQGG